MPTMTMNTNTSSLFADGPSNLGGGQDDHLPVGGPWNGYTFRSAILFAANWSGMVRITKATLRLTTTSQVHVGFSSAPDIYVRRCTANWSANGGRSGADSGGGGGWSTSPTVYPGPASTSTGQGSKRMPTSEGTAVDIDVTSIVRAWAPTSVEGGGNAPNYGLILLAQASSDITEVFSAEASSGIPQITVTYETDSPPVATPTAPSGTVTTNRPTIIATAVDPDGDTITRYGLEVRQGSTVVHSHTTTTGGDLRYVPTADLPSGPLTVRVRAEAGGVWGAYSADLAFVVDRLPIMGAWSAPAASVAGTRRPVHTVAWSDPDGDAGEVYDIEVYSAPGGTPTGSAVYAKANQSTGLTAASVSHTPASDLPGGALAARVRVRTAGVWSAWSTYRAYTVVLTVPTLTWDWPTFDGAMAHYRPAELADPARALVNQAVDSISVKWAAPSGTTISTANIRGEVIDAGIGGPALGTLVHNANVNAAAGAYLAAFRPDTFAPGWLAGTIKYTVTITAANGGVTSEVRHVRFALGEWTGAVALGDAVNHLAASELRKGDEVAVLYRAQTSAGAAAGGSTYGPVATLPAVEAALPATNAYLGLWVRMGRLADDGPNLLVNGDFETGNYLPWVATGSLISVGTDANAPAGSRMLIVTVETGATANPGVAQRVPVIPGATYLFGTWARAAVAGNTARLQIATRDASGVLVNSAALVVATTLTAWAWLEGYVTIPSDGSVASLDVILRIPNLTVGQSVRFDGAVMRGMAVGDSGFDRLALTWKSLG